MTEPDVSVIVPAFEASAALRTCLAALAAQDYPADRFEVIVALNGPRPPADEVWPVGRPRVRAVHEPIPGSFAARNRGVTVASGRTLAFTDSDCVPEPSWVARAHARMASGAADVLAGRVRVTFGDGDRRRAASLYERCFAFRQDFYVKLGFSATANLVTSRRVFDTLGPFDDRLLSCGDVEWCFRARSRGLRLAFAPDVVVAHPARTRRRSLVAKACRMEGGLFLLARLHREVVLPRQMVVTLGDLVYPARVARRVMREPGLTSMRERLAVLVLSQVIRTARVLERQRLRLGGRPRRF